MAKVSLMAYLQNGPPTLPLNPPNNPDPHTTDMAFSYSQIHGLGTWHEFNLANIMQRYDNLLATCMLPADPIGTSPPPSVSHENILSDFIYEMIIPRIRRSLRHGFAHLQANNQLIGITPLAVGDGHLALNPFQFTPHVAYYTAGTPGGTSANRAPGNVKTSWKWRIARANGSAYDRKEYRQVLSQTNYYMKQHKARYGFVLTDLELVAIRRLDNNGNLELSEPIPWETQGSEQQPRLTVLLAMWYIGILAAHDEGPERWNLEQLH